MRIFDVFRKTSPEVPTDDAPLRELCLHVQSGISEAEQDTPSSKDIAHALVAHARRILANDETVTDAERAKILARMEAIMLNTDGGGQIAADGIRDGQNMMAKVISLIARVIETGDVRQAPASERRITPLDEQTLNILIQRCGVRLLSYLDFSETSDRDAPFIINVHDAVLDGAYFGNTYLTGMNLSRARMRTIRVGDRFEDAQDVDLERTAVQMPVQGLFNISDLEEEDPVLYWGVISFGVVHVEYCRQAEGTIAESILASRTESFFKSRLLVNGVIVYADNMPIGFIKGHGEKSFIALRTVFTPNGHALIRAGQICALGVRNEFSRLLLRMARDAKKQGEIPKSAKWVRYDIEESAELLERYVSEGIRDIPEGTTIHDLYTHEKTRGAVTLAPMRFVTQPELYPVFSMLVKQRERFDAQGKTLPRIVS